MFPAEASLYAIEVKSTLTATEMRDAIEKAQKLRSLKYLTGDLERVPELLEFGSDELEPIVPTLFAFESDLRGDARSELDRYLALSAELGDDTQAGRYSPAIRSLCIVGKGYWWFNNRYWFRGDEQGWYYLPSTPERDEVIYFLSAVTNSLPTLIARRGHPKFGRYLYAAVDSAVHLR